MAHEKVVRRSLRPEGWVALCAGWLKNKIIKESIEIKGWEVKEARQISEMEYEYFDEEYRPLNQGDLIFTPDGTAFLRAKTKLPEELKGKKVWFYLQTASEMIIKVNGKWLGGVDPNRDRTLLTPYINENDELLIEIEGYNRSKPDDERNVATKHLKGCRQPFNGAYFVVLDEDILSAVYDTDLLIECMKSKFFPEDFKELVKEELNNAMCLFDFDDADFDFSGTAKKYSDYVKQKIFDDNDYKSSGNVALVSHSHLDIAYYWRRIHAVQKNARTCLIQLRLMDIYSDFKYAHSQPYLYETLEKHFPEMFDELLKRAKEDRFEPVGGMYVESDCNVISTESLVRQFFYGQKYYKEKFGKIVENCWLPDVFGNTWAMPQILKKSGVKYFLSNKMSTWNDTNKFPHNSFIWKGIDGSEIAASVPPTHFITWNTPDQIVENWESYQDKKECPETISIFGYGDGGSGVTEEMIEFMHRLEKLSVMPKLRHITGEQYFKDNLEGNEKLKVWDGELYLEMHRGTFTTKADLKLLNRQLEIKLRDTEYLLTLKMLQGKPYPYEAIEDCYKKLLINQFHDIIPGSHIAPVTKDALADYETINNTLDNLLQEQQECFINTLNIDRAGVTFIEGLSEAVKGSTSQKGEYKGKSGVFTDYKFKRASSVKIETQPLKEEKEWFEFNNNTLKTAIYTAKFGKTGAIENLIINETGRELSNGGLNDLKVYHDKAGNYSAWDILPNYKDKTEHIDCLGTKIKSFGSLFLELETVYKTKKSTITQITRFFKDSLHVEFEHFCDWQETNRLLKAEFNLNILARQGKSDIGGGVITRDTHINTSWQQARFETCQHKWSDLSEGDFGVAIVNDSKYGISFREKQMGLTLLRSSVRPDVDADKGTHRHSYMLVPHDGQVENSNVSNIAFSYNTPILKGEHTKLIDIEGDSLYLQAVKPSDDKKGDIIIRFGEVLGNRGNAKITLPFDIKQAYVTNMLEEIETPLEFEKNKLIAEFKPFEIKTIRIKTNKNNK